MDKKQEERLAEWARSVEERLEALEDAVKTDKPSKKDSPWDLKGGADKLGEFLRG